MSYSSFLVKLEPKSYSSFNLYSTYQIDAIHHCCKSQLFRDTSGFQSARSRSTNINAIPPVLLDLIGDCRLAIDDWRMRYDLSQTEPPWLKP